MFTLARARKASGKGPRVFVLFEKAITTPYRAEIYDGKVAFTDELLKLDLINEWYQLVITWVHSPWWELNTETQIPMSNGNGGDTLTALTVYNHDTATAGVDNWVNISSSNTIAGEFDLETPVRLEITNTYSSGLSTKLLYVGMVKSDDFASNRIPVLEGEAGTAGAGVSSGNSPLASASGGNYKATTWTGTGITTLVTWQIAAADLQRMHGLRFLPILRLANALGTADFDFGWRMVYNTLTPLTPIKWFRPSATDQFIPLNSGEIPPYLADVSGLATLTFALMCRRTTGGSNAVDVDAVYLMPCDPVHGGLRIFTPAGPGFDYTDKFIDDNNTGQTYVDGTATGGGIQGYYRAEGAPLTIRPGTNNQFYFLQTDSNNVPDARRTLTVKAFYRPRKATI